MELFVLQNHYGTGTVGTDDISPLRIHMFMQPLCHFPVCWNFNSEDLGSRPLLPLGDYWVDLSRGFDWSGPRALALWSHAEVISAFLFM
jgi:hypothetical protein